MIKSKTSVYNPTLYTEEFKTLFAWSYTMISLNAPYTLTSNWLLVKHQSIIQKNFQGIWWQLQTYSLLLKKLTAKKYNLIFINLETSYQSFQLTNYKVLNTLMYHPSTKLSNLFYSLVNYIKLYLKFPSVAIILDHYDNSLLRLFHNLLVVTFNLNNLDKGDYDIDFELNCFLTQIFIFKYLLSIHCKK